MKIGLFFGSFNPIHTGHLIIANYIVETTPLDQLWMVVTPHNPHKKRATLANDYDRLHLVNIAVENHNKLHSCDIEFEMPKPSYTIDTLTYLKEKHPEHDFVLIIGGDNLGSFHKWKNYEVILEHYELYVYKRPKYELGALQNHPSISIIDAPLMEISSSIIRQLIRDKKSIRYWVPDKVSDEIERAGMYATPVP
ncbi:nicotinate (nicotinamide) nucleotide adenylyltransferase [Aureispira anguillae]|uniref:Probable nicotinate-nucleotide adenylyltransferase n=1 Tax=Aureispira anguillae TaxID=2864201 RepID=A0A915YAB6_9BACT|nr:nicotinate (nicotinamide) nucleotide adenylyltransferase [Aureispira anguillae]BDS09362.1 nicotinate (nicotinamide) nucleotide adenylyltransferase [Aureispira anguillae]